MPASLTVLADPTALPSCDTLLIIARKRTLLSDAARRLLPSAVSRSLWDDMVKHTEPGDHGRTAVTHTGSRPRKLVAGVLPERCSRHNSPSRAWAIPGLVQGAGLRGDVGIVLLPDDIGLAAPMLAAVARAHPSFSGTSQHIKRAVHVVVPGAKRVAALQRLVDAVRRCADWVDRPPNLLGADALVAEAEAVAVRVGAEIEVIRGRELEAQGLGGLWAVGKASTQAPALVVLDHHPEQARKAVAWVGKGIVYDTGGLSIKSKSGMPSMKTDMGGAAAVLAAFEAAAGGGSSTRLTAVLCIAENAVGPEATRPDDILTLYSGRTVEVNNTDAEGRLVLADGVAWVAKHRQVDHIIDMATLTGAQGVATGKLHAALYCNDAELEARAVRAGRRTGDLVHPLPYAPELFRKEFGSQVADMRNSVKDRGNAQPSCAGQFIANHLRAQIPWLHIDMAGPARNGSRGTGYGVALLLGLLGD